METGSAYNPLVSIVVLTYNSAKFVTETLESIKRQTYRNLELIISDDSSTDNTVEVCRKWVQDNTDNSFRAKVLTVHQNTGVSANCNRGLAIANGDWIKFIAGDDTLVIDCIEKYVDYISSSKDNVSSVYANMNVFNSSFTDENFIQATNYSDSIFNRNNITAQQQFNLLLRYVYFGGPSIFLKKEMLININGFDEEMPYDDWPLFLRITGNGNKIFYLNKITVNYRIHNSSSCNYGVSNNLLFNSFYTKDKIVYKKYRKNHLSLLERLIEESEFRRKYLFIKCGLNKPGFFNTWFNSLFIALYVFSKRSAFYLVNRGKCLL
jgi:alpha-1,3-rhamnosyltransferase